METDYVSIPLTILVKDLLGANHYVPISQITAECILFHTGNKRICHIQFPSIQDVDVSGKTITSPILWELNAWRTSVERQVKSALRAQEQRETKFVYEGNVNMIKKRIMENFGLDEQHANIYARMVLDKKDYARIRAYGVKRLYTNVKELP